MLASEIAIFSLLSFLFLIVGGIVGWLTRTHLFENQVRQVYVHPEMFDDNGNIIPDEILAVRFENDYDSISDEDEEEDE
jgi:hypothetical protein